MKQNASVIWMNEKLTKMFYAPQGEILGFLANGETDYMSLRLKLNSFSPYLFDMGLKNLVAANVVKETIIKKRPFNAAYALTDNGRKFVDACLALETLEVVADAKTN